MLQGLSQQRHLLVKTEQLDELKNSEEDEETRHILVNFSPVGNYFKFHVGIPFCLSELPSNSFHLNILTNEKSRSHH